MFSFMKDDVMNTVLGTDTWWWWVSCSVMSDSCDPMDCSLPGLSIHGILQATVPEWVAISFSRGSSRPRNQTQFSCIAGRQILYWLNYEGRH